MAADPGLRNDPFARSGQQATAGGAAGDAALLNWPPLLNAVVVAGRDSLVMIGDRRLKLGDEFGGYRLYRVRPGQAIFLKDGRRFVVDVLPPPSNNGTTKEKQ